MNIWVWIWIVLVSLGVSFRIFVHSGLKGDRSLPAYLTAVTIMCALGYVCGLGTKYMEEFLL